MKKLNEESKIKVKQDVLRKQDEVRKKGQQFEIELEKKVQEQRKRIIEEKFQQTSRLKLERAESKERRSH